MALLGSTPIGPRDVPREKNRVTFLEKPNSSSKAPKSKVIAHLFQPFLVGPQGYLRTLTRPSERAFPQATRGGQKKKSFKRPCVVQEKPIFFYNFKKKFPKNYQSLPAALGNCLGGLLSAQWMSQGETQATFGKKLNSSPQAPRPKAIAHCFGISSWPPRAALKHWLALLQAPSHGRPEAARTKQKFFGSPEVVLTELLF